MNYIIRREKILRHLTAVPAVVSYYAASVRDVPRKNSMSETLNKFYLFILKTQ